MSVAAVEEFNQYPPYVLSDADRERWDLSRGIAEKIAEVNEATDDRQFVWYTTRWIYASDAPTGTQADQDAAIEAAAEHAKSLGLGSDSVGTVEEASDASPDPAEELFERIKAEKPEKGASAEQWDAHTGLVADLLGLLYGDPDQFDFGEYESMPPAELGEAFGGSHPGVPYSALLHPRDRVGRWAQKLNGLQHFVAKNRAGVRMALSSHLAAASLRWHRMRAGLPGGVFHPGKISGEQMAAAHRALLHQEAGREHFMAMAAEERKRHGVSGAERQAVKATTIGLGQTLQGLAYIYSQKHEEEMGAITEPARDAGAAVERQDEAQISGDAAHKLARYVMEHRSELGAVLHGAGHLAHTAARARGLVAAEVPDEDWIGEDAAIIALAEVETPDDVLADLGL